MFPVFLSLHKPPQKDRKKEEEEEEEGRGRKYHNLIMVIKLCQIKIQLIVHQLLFLKRKNGRIETLLYYSHDPNRFLYDFSVSQMYWIFMLTAL